jgi:hypothetical protein
MAFEVIPGGLDGLMFDEMTEEQQRQYDLAWWDELKPADGSIEATIRYAQIDSADLATTIHTLDTIHRQHAAEAAAKDMRDEWKYCDLDYCLRQLQLKAREEHVKI